jgi:hypothetical protein
MRRPSFDDWWPLDADHIRTRYLQQKAARLAGGKVNDHPRVIWRDHLSTSTCQVMSVWGDSGLYRVWLRTTVDPWQAACSRGGVHDAQRDGEACSHGVAAAVHWLRMHPHLAEEVRADV